MPRDLLLWVGVAALGVGLAAIVHRRAPGGSLGGAVFCAGSAALAAFAVMERHFLLLAAVAFAGVPAWTAWKGGRRNSLTRRGRP